jgi:DNA polymerase-1
MRPTNPKYMCVDVETTGLDWTRDTLHGFAVAYEEEEAFYVPSWNIPSFVKEDLENPSIKKIGHNFHGFDAKFIFKSGIKIQGTFIENMGIWQLVDDTTPLGLKWLSEQHIGASSLDKKRLLDQAIERSGAKNIAGLCFKDLHDPSHPYLKVIGDYCEEDANNTLSLSLLGMQKLKELDQQLRSNYRVSKTPLDYFKEEFTPLEYVLFKMETKGFRVNIKVIEELKKEAEKKKEEITERLNRGFKKEIEIIEKQIWEEAVSRVVTPKAKASRVQGQGKLAFSWENNNHAAKVFFEQGNIPEDLVTRTEKGSYATDKTTLQKLLQELPKEHKVRRALPLYAEYKLNQKTLTTYTGDTKKGIYSKIRQGEDGNHYIYPTFRQTTNTGRLACKSPNMQNIPRGSKIKELFIPTNDNNVFDHFDYSQIELRLAGHLSKDPAIISSYLNKEDLHKQTAATIFDLPLRDINDIQRQGGKTTNFLTIYKGSAFRLQESLREGVKLDFSLDECKEFISRFFDKYRDLDQYLKNVLSFVVKNGFVISEAGRMRRLPDIFYGEEGNLDFRLRQFNGSQEQRQKLISILRDQQIYNPSEQDIFWLAYKKYNHASKQAFNFPDQSLAASLAKRAMIQLDKEGFDIRNQVHDALDIERALCDNEATSKVRNIMENVFPECLVPLTTDYKTLRSFSEEDKA